MTAPLVTGSLSRDGRTVLVRCPYCAAEHRHGAAGIVDQRNAHRVAHCPLPSSVRGIGYIVRLPGAST